MVTAKGAKNALQLRAYCGEPTKTIDSSNMRLVEKLNVRPEHLLFSVHILYFAIVIYQKESQCAIKLESYIDGLGRSKNKQNKP